MCSISFLASFTYPWTFFLSGQWILHCLQTSPSHRRLRQWGAPFSPQLPVTAFCHLSQWWLHFLVGSAKKLEVILVSSVYLTHSLCKSHWLDLHNNHQESSQVIPPSAATPIKFTTIAHLVNHKSMLKDFASANRLLSSHQSHWKLQSQWAIVTSWLQTIQASPFFSPKETHNSSHDLLDPKMTHKHCPPTHIHILTHSLRHIPKALVPTVVGRGTPSRPQEWALV